MNVAGEKKNWTYICSCLHRCSIAASRRTAQSKTIDGDGKCTSAGLLTSDNKLKRRIRGDKRSNSESCHTGCAGCHSGNGHSSGEEPGCTDRDFTANWDGNGGREHQRDRNARLVVHSVRIRYRKTHIANPGFDNSTCIGRVHQTSSGAINATS